MTKAPDCIYGSHTETLTCLELIKLLQQYNPDTPVVTEGCDCVGRSRNVKEEVDDNGMIYLIIER